MTENFLQRSRRRARDAADRWWGPLHPGAVRHATTGRRRHDILVRWRRAVHEVGLSERMYLPGRVHRIEPRITRVILGRSERFTIRLGTGQTYDDVVAAGKSIARAFEVPRIRLTELSDDLVEIELLTSAGAATAAATAPTAPTTPGPRAAVLEAAA